LQLGADVPVFVYGYTAWGEGVGEQLSAVSLPEDWFVIIHPGCHVNTKQIFCAENLTRDSIPITMNDFIEGDRKNDCAEIVCALYPQVKQAMHALSSFSEARLTGTGACVFAQFSSEYAAREAYDILARDWAVFLAHGFNRSPLYNKLEQG
jgi:4-diphosphocytidyl-2-C-methyl-D-erythritol kinase